MPRLPLDSGRVKSREPILPSLAKSGRFSLKSALPCRKKKNPFVEAITIVGC
jgi:hypothetical protein